MKVKEKQQAVQLRERGVSMGEIAQRLGVAKSSVSLWVRDVKLTKTQRSKLNRNGHSVDAIEKRRIARVSNTQKRRDEMMRIAGQEVAELSHNPLWCIAVALYWGEGGKTQQTARLSNSDPAVIKIMMHFFRGICNIPEEKFRGHVHTFSHKNANVCEKYWSDVSGLPRDKLFKTYVKQSSASKKKRNTLPYGTFQVYVHDTEFFFRMMGWIEEIKKMKNI
ncbi:MAG: transposase-like protein [Candidatus Azotimanducaceae bacterium]|jgi:transposase-like protein